MLWELLKTANKTNNIQKQLLGIQKITLKVSIQRIVMQKTSDKCETIFL